MVAGNSYACIGTRKKLKIFRGTLMSNVIEFFESVNLIYKDATILKGYVCCVPGERPPHNGFSSLVLTTD
jgi:hypothetical protein